MVDIVSKDVGDLVIARDGGMWLIGRAQGRTLSPVFELACDISQAPGARGQTVQYGALPLMLLEDLGAWPLSEGAPLWPIKGMSVERHLARAFEGGEEAADGLKIARGRVVLATVGPK